MKVILEKVLIQEVIQYLISHPLSGINYATLHKMIQGLASGIDVSTSKDAE